MSTSDHDIRYSTELLDRQRLSDEVRKVGNSVVSAIGSLETSLTDGLYAINGAIEDGNYELATIRSNMNKANTISIIQRHKLNKMVKNYTEF